MYDQPTKKGSVPKASKARVASLSDPVMGRASVTGSRIGGLSVWAAFRGKRDSPQSESFAATLAWPSISRGTVLCTGPLITQIFSGGSFFQPRSDFAGPMGSGDSASGVMREAYLSCIGMSMEITH